MGITYDSDVLRLMHIYQELGLYVGSVVITKYNAQESAELFKNRLEKLGIKVYRHYLIPGYPTNVPFIVSDDGYGKNDYIENKPSSGRCDCSGTWKWKDGCLPVTIIS